MSANNPTPEIDYISPTVVPLTPKERKALSLSDDWARQNIDPVLSGGGKVVSYCGPLPEGDAVSVIAADAVDCLSSLYPPGHTGVHLVPAKKVENGFVQAFESGLRGKGFTLLPETTADAVAVAYTLDALFEKGEKSAWYLQLRITDRGTGGKSIARAYTASGQPEAGQSRTEIALKRSILQKAADTTRNALSE